MQARRLFQTTAAAMILLMITGCSTFNRKWSRTVSLDDGTPTGCWQGSWTSMVNNHQGGLRCIITSAPSNVYSASFRATYMKVLNFEPELSIKMEQEGDSWRFEGQEDLGKMSGGLYRYSGLIKDNTFESLYSNSWDRGFFYMHKVIKPDALEEAD